MFLQNFEKALLENLICSYGISFSRKMLSVLTIFWTRSPGNFDIIIFLPPGKSYVFLRNFEKALLENLMCSYKRIIYVFSWKIRGVLVASKPPGKFDVF